MNFNLIEGAYADLDSIHDEFCEDYLWSMDLTNVEIRKKYGLSVKEFYEFARIVKEEYGIAHRGRRVRNTGKYYYRAKKRWSIAKTINGVLVFFGTVPNEEIAKRLVELCKLSEWDLDSCFEFVKNYERYV